MISTGSSNLVIVCRSSTLVLGFVLPHGLIRLEYAIRQHVLLLGLVVDDMEILSTRRALNSANLSSYAGNRPEAISAGAC